MPFVIDTFIDHRYDPPTRVFHPTGDQDDWTALRNQYNDKRRWGGNTNHIFDAINPTTEAVLYFDVWPDIWRILVDAKRLQAGHVVPLDAWLGIYIEPFYSWQSRVAWMKLDEDDIIIRSYDKIPTDHLQTDSFTISGFDDRAEEHILGEIAENLGVPKFLLSYREDVLKYEVEVAVPKANTHKYLHLREQHVRA